MAKKQKSAVSDAWYSIQGKEQDVVLSTKAMLRRNLANFPFSPKLHDSESERIQSIVFDAFNLMDDAYREKLLPNNAILLDNLRYLHGNVLLLNR